MQPQPMAWGKSLPLSVSVPYLCKMLISGLPASNRR